MFAKKYGVSHWWILVINFNYHAWGLLCHVRALSGDLSLVSLHHGGNLTISCRHSSSRFFCKFTITPKQFIHSFLIIGLSGVRALCVTEPSGHNCYLSSSSFLFHVFTLPEVLYVGFWIFACKLILTKNDKNQAKP